MRPAVVLESISANLYVEGIALGKVALSEGLIDDGDEVRAAVLVLGPETSAEEGDLQRGKVLRTDELYKSLLMKLRLMAENLKVRGCAGSPKGLRPLARTATETTPGTVATRSRKCSM